MLTVIALYILKFVLAPLAAVLLILAVTEAVRPAEAPGRKLPSSTSTSAPPSPPSP